MNREEPALSQPQGPAIGLGQRLGIVVSGSLSGGLEVKLDPEAPLEAMSVGRYVTIQGEQRRYFGLITDIKLGAIDPRLAVTPPDVSHPFIREVTRGTSIFGTLHVRPELVIGGDAASLLEGPQPVKSIPSHYAPVHLATEQDVARVFGDEDERHFFVGNPLDLEARVCLDMERLAQRSSGIFGKSGTGKTFLTRLLLIGLLQKGQAVNLVFDMHSEYGWEATSEAHRRVKGLKQLFPSRVAVFTLDERHAQRRRVSPDYIVRIGYGEIEPEDITLLRQTLGLTEAAVQASYRLARKYGDRHWLEAFLALDRDGLNALAGELGEHEATIAALRRRLEHLRRFPFLVPGAGEDSVQHILRYLDRGLHVVLEFGSYERDDTAYVLVANLITRRLHQRYRERTEESLASGAQAPRPLVITLEEAHKFLNPEVSRHTTFGAIAREMRKYQVSLLVIDQRPSGIDEEVMSQLGTKITYFLDNERDVDAALAGVSGKGELKTVLSRLETQQQALIFGHAVPMPVVVRTREYGSAQSYRELGYQEGRELERQVAEDRELWA